MDTGYSLAMSEVLCIIEQSDDNYRNKISKGFINFMKENCNPEYHPNFDINTPIKDLELRKETKNLLALIHRSYICGEEEKIEYQRVLKENSEKEEQQLNEKYDVYKIFEQKQNKSLEAQEVDNQPKNLVQYKKESIIIRILNRIKNFFKRG